MLRQGNLKWKGGTIGATRAGRVVEPEESRGRRKRDMTVVTSASVFVVIQLSVG